MAATGITGSGSGGGFGGLPIYSYSFDVDFNATTGIYKATYTFTQGGTSQTLVVPVSIWQPPLEFRLHEIGKQEAMRITESHTPTIRNQITAAIVPGVFV